MTRHTAVTIAELRATPSSVLRYVEELEKIAL